MKTLVLRMVCICCMAVASCSSGPPAVAEGTAGEVELAWRTAVVCLEDEGWVGQLEPAAEPGTWQIAFIDNDPFEIEGFEDLYDSCVMDAEAASVELLVENLAVGQERVEGAESLRMCVAEAGLDDIEYSIENPDSAATLADGMARLGHDISGTDPSMFDDPGWPIVLECFNLHRNLFPDLLEDQVGN